MGYSCTKAAVDTLTRIEAAYRVEGSGNVMHMGRHYSFFERGRENADGSITGRLVDINIDPSIAASDVFKAIEHGTCRIAGSVKIDADGIVVRFPHMPRNVRTNFSMDALRKRDNVTLGDVARAADLHHICVLTGAKVYGLAETCPGCNRKLAHTIPSL